jgi:hypothetical protein
MMAPSRSCETSEPFLIAQVFPVSDSRFRLLKKHPFGAYPSSYLLRLIEHTMWPNPWLRIHCGPLRACSCLFSHVRER